MNNAYIIKVINMLDSFANKKLPQKISFAISKNLKILNKEYEFYQEQLQKLLNNYSEYFEKNDDGNVKVMPNGVPMIVEPHNHDFEDELVELLSMEIDVTLYKINPDSFDYDGEKYDALSPSEITNLMEILCDNEE